MSKHSPVLWLPIIVVISASCTVPNPESCLDGLCTDQRYPYCDVDGQAAGLPNACIAVDCSPGEFAFCRGDVAVTCNGAGNDYELVECQLGCGTTGCKSCATNEQCSDSMPVCDVG